MENSSTHRPVVAVIGAGPAGIYAAHKLAQSGVEVLLLNRDIKPGGLAEYGIYFDKHKMKNGLRKQFTKILEHPAIHYLGGIEIHNEKGALTLEDIEKLGCAAYLVTVGAQGTRKLGLEGEDDISGIFHAKDIVYHYNQLPPFASRDYPIGQHVGIIGMGNVMVDIAHWLIWEKKVASVTVLARRGPAERAYTDKEMREIILALDAAQLDQEIERIAPNLREIGQDPEALKAEMRKPLEKAESFESPTSLRFRFLVSTSRLIPDEKGRLAAVELTHNRLIQKGERLNAQTTDEKEILPLDTLIFAIGDQVDPKLGLPEKWGQYLTPSAPHPNDPQRPRYEIRAQDADAPREGWFLGGWARIASDGLVGKARMDGEQAAQEVITWLEAHPPKIPRPLAECSQHLRQLLQERNHPFVSYADVQRLEAIEAARAKAADAPLFKFNTNEEMLDALQKGG